ncbi:Uncharacterised protein [Bordetella ansorpii]|uniref:Uncharacterized protein n=1 Tax=Bordetella ansorpii TaxID=288768 RepID=A0A157R8T6_9BORD|nr:hypothetical protein [Bordetella ansorpii]SAI54400.1 Uncharacterised protein [Bordetella ansorpii]
MLRRLPSDAVTIEVLSGPDEVARCRLVLAAGQVSEELTGCVLEACYAWQQGYMVFLTQDMLFEEVLVVYLLDSGGKVLDQARLSALYTAAAVSDLREHGSSSILFSFFHADEWEVRLYMSAQRCWRWPWPGKLVKRSFQLRRYFDLVMRVAPSETDSR